MPAPRRARADAKGSPCGFIFLLIIAAMIGGIFARRRIAPRTNDAAAMPVFASSHY
jgi:hypothetical protein